MKAFTRSSNWLEPVQLHGRMLPKSAVEKAAGSLRDLRIGEVGKLDMTIEKGKVALFRARVTVSFKFDA